MKAEDFKFYSNFFDGNKRQYIIPVYQRNYDWSTLECRKLFDDIIFSFDHEKEHYIGSFIQVQKDEEHGIKPFIVIDGQQRLTTIYLLIRALMDFEENADRQEVLHDSVFNSFKGTSPNEPSEKYKLKLKANTNDNNQLLKLMNNKLEEMDKASNIYKNYELFKQLIKEKVADNCFPNDIKKGIEKLVCVVISLNEAQGDDPQVIFERMNSTGLPLELDDLVRNYVLMTAINQEELFNEYWAKIENLIPKEQRASFIIDYLSAYTTIPVSSKNSYESFKKWAEGKPKEDILKTLTRFAKYYAAFIADSPAYSKAINEKLENLRRLKQSTLYTFLFHVFDDFENKIISEEVLLKILTLVLSYSVRRLVCEIPSNRLRGLYKNLYNRAFENVSQPYDYYDVFASFMLNELIDMQEFPDDRKFAQYLEETRLYRYRKLARFILGSLENHNSREKIYVDSEEISIEHILPQNKQNINWRQVFGDEYERIYNTYLDTLGNLTLTGYNQALSDNSFTKKQEILLKTKTKITFLNKEFIESAEWTEEVIKTRAKRLSREVTTIFAYPTYSGRLYHEKPALAFITVDLESVGNAVNTRPLYYEFLREKREAKSYTDITAGVLNTLYAIDGIKLKDLAINKFKPSTRSTRIHLSTEKNDIPQGDCSEIGNTGIYFNKRQSAKSLLGFLKLIFEEYSGIDVDDFVIYCRRNETSNDDAVEIGPLN